MKEVEITIKYSIYESKDELSSSDKELVEAAIRAQKNSYAPYSKFNVGAAIRLDNGKIVIGANQENAAYPSGLCAERTAMFAAGANYPDNAMVSLACAAGPEMSLCDIPGTPCGDCRQVMAQYQRKGGRKISILLVGAKEIWKFEKVDDILPFIFDSI